MFSLSVVMKIPHAAVFKVHIYDACDAYVLTVGLVGNEAADAAYDEVDLHAASAV